MTFHYIRVRCIIIAVLVAIFTKVATSFSIHSQNKKFEKINKEQQVFAGIVPMAQQVAEAAVLSSLLFGTMMMNPTAAANADSIGGNLERGQELFTNNCASCHMGGMNVIKEKKTLRKDALEKFIGLDEEKVKTFVQESGQHKRLIFPKVPGGRLTDEDYTDVVTYIVDQASGDKW